MHSDLLLFTLAIISCHSDVEESVLLSNPRTCWTKAWKETPQGCLFLFLSLACFLFVFSCILRVAFIFPCFDRPIFIENLQGFYDVSLGSIFSPFIPVVVVLCFFLVSFSCFLHTFDSILRFQFAFLAIFLPFCPSFVLHLQLYDHLHGVAHLVHNLEQLHIQDCHMAGLMNCNKQSVIQALRSARFGAFPALSVNPL